jgi:hypothetical protein
MGGTKLVVNCGVPPGAIDLKVVLTHLADVSLEHTCTRGRVLTEDTDGVIPDQILKETEMHEFGFAR